MQRDAVAVRHVGDRARVLGGQRLAHRMGVGVLDGDHAADRLVRIGRIAERGLDLVKVQRAVGPVVEAADARPDDDRVAGRLVAGQVVVLARDRLLAAAEMGELGDDIAHRPRGHEQPGLLAEQLGGARLERNDRRVVAEHVVADFGLGHRAAHGRTGLRDGVAAEVDHGHECRV